MWCVETLEYRERVLDFRSAGLGQRSVVALYADGEMLVNALSLVNFEDAIAGPVQVHVCEDCGHTSCAPGGWVALRRFADAVLWTPAFTDMLSETSGISEYAPPSVVRSRGIPTFALTKYRELRARVPALPAFEMLTELRWSEAARLLQLAAPGRVLGQFPDAPRPRRDAFLTTSDGELATQLTNLSRTLEAALDSRAAAREVTLKTPIGFCLDLPGTPEWTPLGVAHEALAIQVLPDRFALPDEDSA